MDMNSIANAIGSLTKLLEVTTNSDKLGLTDTTALQYLIIQKLETLVSSL